MQVEHLERIFDECDENDPAVMDKILICLDNLYAEDDEYIEILADKLQNNVILWERPWYQKNVSFSRSFKDNEKHEESFRTDRMTKEETDIINKNWKEFVKEFNVPDKPISFARWRQLDKSKKLPGNPAHYARLFVTTYLARGLQRSLPQVYRQFKNLHLCTRKGTYLEIEKKVMDICFLNESKKALIYISHLLNREERGIYKRYKIAIGDTDNTKMRVRWKLDLASKFVNNFLECTGTKLKKLRNRVFDRNVWIQIQDKMNIPYYNLKMFWYIQLHPQLFIKEDVKMRTLRKRILKVLKNSEYKIWSDIRWKTVLEEFGKGYTEQFLRRILFRLVLNVPKYTTRPLQEVVSLSRQLLKNTRRKNFRLKHLRLNSDGMLEVYDIRNESE